jgi:hypothetical protein
MNTRPGRPRQDITRTTLIGARFTSQEAEWIHAAVQKAGQVKSDWIRAALLGAAGQDVPLPRTPSMELPTKSVAFDHGLGEFLD